MKRRDIEEVRMDTGTSIRGYWYKYPYKPVEEVRKNLMEIYLTWVERSNLNTT